MLQNQHKNFHSPAFHVAIAEKLVQELKEIKPYCLFHMHIWRILPGKKNINSFRQSINLLDLPHNLSKGISLLSQGFLTVWNNAKL